MAFGDGETVQNGPTGATEGPVLGVLWSKTFHPRVSSVQKVHWTCWARTTGELGTV